MFIRAEKISPTWNSLYDAKRRKKGTASIPTALEMADTRSEYEKKNILYKIPGRNKIEGWSGVSLVLLQLGYLSFRYRCIIDKRIDAMIGRLEVLN